MQNVIKFPKLWLVGFRETNKPKSQLFTDGQNGHNIYAHSPFEAASFYLSKFINENINKGDGISVELISELIVCIDYSDVDKVDMIVVNDIMEHHGSKIVDLYKA